MKQLLVLLLLYPLCCSSQYLLEAYTTYDDSFTEWQLISEAYDENEQSWYESVGTFSQTFSNRNDWSSWQLQLNDVDVECRLKWKDNPNHWVMYTPDNLITIRTVWKDDFRKWKITSRSQTISIKAKYANQSDDWVLDSKSKGSWKMYTDREGDPREWIIEDDLNSSVDIFHKLAMTFIVLIHSSPRI